MNKTTVVVSCPIDTYSGYGARARDFVKALLQIDKYDVKVLGQRWGNTPYGYLKDHNEDKLASIVLDKLTFTPDIWIQITVPNEFQRVGKYNIGVTAGIETTICDVSWLQGCNRMDLTLTSSNHSKNVFTNTVYDAKDNRTGADIKIKLEKPVEVLLEGADLTKYFTVNKLPDSKIVADLNSIKESFCFLFVGHWLQGDFGQDRKNVGYTIKSFLETFKNKLNQPALILKTSRGPASLIDQERILHQIEDIKSSVKGSLPSVYLLHGDMSDEEVNLLYNHPKVKAMISFTKGEGFGRPLLEFSLSGKPIIASGWSGQLDFLKPENSFLVGGQLTKIHKSAVSKNVILEESSWFTPDDLEVAKMFKFVYKQYKDAIKRGGAQRAFSKKYFSFEIMTEKLREILDKNVPEFPKQIELKLPDLELPKLQANG